MASSFPAASAASVTDTTSASSLSFDRRHCSRSRVSFRLSSKPKLRISAKVLRSNFNNSTVVKAQLNEVAVDGSSNAASTPPTNSKVPEQEEKDTKTEKGSSPSASASEESISEFIAQVASLVKLVDSKDIMELQMKQLDCELIIRKKEAFPQPPPPSSMAMMHAQSPPAAMPSAYPPAAAPAPPTPASSAALATSPSLPAAKSTKSSLPPLKSPMAGTFYRSPGPAEPPFVKVGDKVQKGQVLCIVEAMKLMNEIEADQSGTIVEVIAEDGKPVSVDTPLFVIVP